MRKLNLSLASFALCLVLATSPAIADNSGTALKVIGVVVTAIGIFTDNPALIKWGWATAFSGDVCGSGGAARRLRRRRTADPELPAPRITTLRVDRPDA